MRSICKVLNLLSGKIEDAENLLSRMSEQAKHDLRRSQLGVESICQYGCPVCDQAVYLTGRREEYFFKHFPNRGDCPVKDGVDIARGELNAIIYNGVKESKRHKELKFWLGNFLKNLPESKGFEDVQIEKRLTSTSDKMRWRQPDVSCGYKGKKLVFELQLNSTFVDIISAREKYYFDEGTYIFWLFDGFDPKNSKFGERDIFWLNKSNAFVITNETRNLSEEKCDLIFKCYYNESYIDGDSLCDKWVDRLVSVDDLTFRDGYYKPFLFDSDLIKRKFEGTLLRSEFEKYFWGERKTLDSCEVKERDGYFIGRFKIHLQGCRLPDKFTNGFVKLIDAIYFLKTKKVDVLNCRLDNIKEFTENILQYHQQHGYIYCWAVRVFCADLKSGDLGVKLAKKVHAFSDEFVATKNHMPNNQDSSYNPILKIIFPELEDHLFDYSS